MNPIQNEKELSCRTCCHFATAGKAGSICNRCIREMPAWKYWNQPPKKENELK